MHASAIHSPHFIGNHLALDFLNSAYGVGENRCDCLEDDAGALAWLQAAHLPAPDVGAPVAGLGALARSLREAGARLVDAGAPPAAGDLDLVNRILEAGQPLRQLAPDADGGYAMMVRRRDDDAASLLEPVAAAFAHLLVDGDLAQVRRCEAHDCTLRFLDSTRSKRRRWCSMALCGNRMKVAAFRARRDAGVAGPDTGPANHAQRGSR